MDEQNYTWDMLEKFYEEATSEPTVDTEDDSRARTEAFNKYCKLKQMEDDRRLKEATLKAKIAEAEASRPSKGQVVFDNVCKILTPVAALAGGVCGLLGMKYRADAKKYAVDRLKEISDMDEIPDKHIENILDRD